MMWIVILLVVVIVIIALCVKIVPQATCFVVEFLGSYQATWQNGLHFKIPFIQRIAKKVSLKEQVADFPPQPVITKDNVDEAEFWGNFDLEDGYWSETANVWNTYAIE